MVELIGQFCVSSIPWISYQQLNLNVIGWLVVIQSRAPLLLTGASLHPNQTSNDWALIDGLCSRVEELAKKGFTMAQIALAWAMSKPCRFTFHSGICFLILYAHLDVTAPIVGTTSLENLKELIGTSTTCIQHPICWCVHIAAVDIQLTKDKVKYLEEPYQTQAVFSHYWSQVISMCVLFCWNKVYFVV